MNRLLSLLALAIFVFAAYASGDENVVVNRLDETYTFVAGRDGKPSEIRKSKTATYLAERADAHVIAAEPYADGMIKITKASAPGSRPVYRAWETDDNIFYSGERICALPMDLKKGKPMKAVFESICVEPEQFCTIMLCENVPVRAARYEITVPSALAARIKVQPYDLRGDMKFSRTELKSGDIIYSVEASNIPAYHSEPHSSNPLLTRPRIVVSGYFADVDELYAYLRSHVQPEEPSQAVSTLAKELTSDCSTDFERIDTIAAWVRQNIRYIAMEHGIYGRQPDMAASVLEKRYGDCKGSANLIRMMLRSVGIDGRLAWAGTKGEVIGRFSEYPGLAAGNHMIACAFVGDSIVLADGTTAYAPRGYVPAALGDTELLIEDGDSYRLYRVPVHDVRTDRITVAGSFTLADKALSGTLHITLEGRERMIFENTVAAVSAPKRPTFYLRYFKPTQTAEHSGLVISTAASNAAATEISLSETDRGTVTATSSKTYVSLRPWRLLRLALVDTSDRHNDLNNTDLQYITSKITFKVPEGYEVLSVPKSADISDPWYEANMRYDLDGDTITVSGTLRAISGEASLADIPAWNRCIRAIEQMNTAPIVLKTKEQ